MAISSSLVCEKTLYVLEPFELLEDTTVLSDEMILIGTTQNRAENAFRLIKVLDTKGKELHLITNQ